jgi:predicted lipid-binding transport protein (Tim44 family)
MHTGTWRSIGVALALVAGTCTGFARGGGGCLAAGTLVATPSGDVAVETLQAGSIIWGCVEGQRAPVRLAAVRQVEAAEFVEVAGADGAVVLATTTHLFQVGAGEFRAAGQLAAPGAGGFPVARQRCPAARPAYDLLVESGGVFFANGLPVHNKGCFLPDTPVLLADGTSRPIGEVRVGDGVLAFDAAGRTVPARVKAVLVHEVEGYLVVRTERVELRVTEEHPFFVGEGTFKTIGSLRVGDTVWAHNGAGAFTPQRLLSVERVQAHTTVFNLQTEEPHTYFADGIAVHNKGGGCFAAGTLVATPSGERAIEELALGDEVLAPEADGALCTTTVQGLYLNFTPLLTLHTDRGMLGTTAEHPLLGDGGGFARADAFEVGDRLVCAGGLATIERIEAGTDPVPVFNLSVGGPHAFFADGFVAHNKGGGGFRSSSHSSGTRSGGSADPGALVVVGGIIVLVIVLKVFGKVEKGGGVELDFCFDRSAIEGKAAKTRAMLEFIARVDSKWTAAALTEVARETFLELQRCWMAREYGPMQPRMMPDLYEQHCAQLAGLRQTHEINKLDQLTVEGVDVVHVCYTDRPADRTFTALITANARDIYLDDRTQAFLRGDAAPARFQEFWTFQMLEGQWRLRDIEQTRESAALTTENLFEQFTDVGRDQIYGATAGQTGPAGPALPAAVLDKDDKIGRLLNFLVQTDPIWKREAMTATARRVFLNVLLAWQDGRPEAFTGVALSPEIDTHLRAVNASNTAGSLRVEYRNLCVRKVEIVHVDNRDDRTLDNFTARIGAHAQVVVLRGETVVRRDPDVRAWVDYWTFGRDNGRWVLREILPDEQGASIVDRENVDEGSSAQMLEWYYSKPRAT